MTRAQVTGGRSAARLGVLLPSSNICSEPDFQRLAPPGVTVHATRMPISEATPEGLRAMTQALDLGVEMLAAAGVDIIAYACTSGSMLEGPGHDAELARRIKDLSGIPAVTTSAAVVDALREAGARTLGVGTPYIDDINVRVVRFLEGSGFHVAQIEGLQIRDGLEFGLRPPQEVFELGCRVDSPGADAVFLSCTNFRGAEVSRDLAAALGKPVVTSNEATIWAALRALGIVAAGELLAR